MQGVKMLIYSNILGWKDAVLCIKWGDMHKFRNQYEYSSHIRLYKPQKIKDIPY